MSRTHIGAALAVAARALAGTASADTTEKSHGSHDRTIRLVEANKELQPTFVDVGKPGPSVGDVVVARDDVLRENGSPAGAFLKALAGVAAISTGTRNPISVWEVNARV